MSSRPIFGLPDHSAGFAVFCRMSRTWFALIFGSDWSNSATAPATCGDDMDVPLRFAYDPSSTGYVERIRPPGAPMSGLSVRSGVTPYELKLEIRPPVGFGSDTTPEVHVIAGASAAMRPSIIAPSAEPIETTGIVIDGVPATVGFTMPAALL